MNKKIEEKIKMIKEAKRPYTIWFDIDGTLVDTDEQKYDEVIPDEAMIALVNHLHYLGHKIILLTARGATSKIDWRELTESQLKKWGVQYHELLMGRPKDLIIDDVGLRPNEFLELM